MELSSTRHHQLLRAHSKLSEDAPEAHAEDQRRAFADGPVREAPAAGIHEEGWRVIRAAELASLAPADI